MSTEPGSGSSIGLHRPRARRQEANRAAKIVTPFDFTDFTTTCTGPEGCVYRRRPCESRWPTAG
eukprot:6931119-Prymnesium_polylepis.1